MATYVLKKQLGVQGRRAEIGSIFDGADLGDEMSISDLLSAGVLEEVPLSASSGVVSVETVPAPAAKKKAVKG